MNKPRPYRLTLRTRANAGAPVTWGKPRTFATSAARAAAARELLTSPLRDSYIDHGGRFAVLLEGPDGVRLVDRVTP